MPRQVIYQGDIPELLKRMKEKHFMDGECAKLPQALTDVGHTSRWQPGERVVDLTFLRPGTVIANFKFENGKARFPNQHGYHVALFHEFGEARPGGGYWRIWVIDQWIGKSVDRRYKKAWTPQEVKNLGIKPADNANEFYVVLVP